LTGCGQKVPVKVVKPPVELLSCSDEPVPPSLPDDADARDALMLDYVLSLRAAWGDCSSKVAGVRAWSEALPD
jgi:hypothetical protein